MLTHPRDPSVRRFTVLPRSPAGWTIAIFGVLAVGLGLVGLIRPEAILELLGFEVLDRAGRATGDYTVVYLTASSMAAVNMGAYYLLAAAVEFRPFFLWTVPFRLLTCTVFTLLVVTGVAPDRFVGVALWEGIGAVATAVALGYESRHRRTSGSGLASNS